PPYKAVNRQEATPRGKLRVVGVGLSPDYRTLVLTTDPHPQAVSYALHLPGIRSSDSTNAPVPIDIAYNLNGVEAAWFGGADRTVPKWTGWLPHINWEVNQAFESKSAEHETLFGNLTRRGLLQLRTQVALPKGKNRLRIESSRPFEAT